MSMLTFVFLAVALASLANGHAHLCKYGFELVNHVCVDINGCTKNPCGSHALNCTDVPASQLTDDDDGSGSGSGSGDGHMLPEDARVCSCILGYIGDDCDEIDGCVEKPCGVHAMSCTDLADKKIIGCSETDGSGCEGRHVSGGRTCVCHAGYTGDDCDVAPTTTTVTETTTTTTTTTSTTQAPTTTSAGSTTTVKTTSTTTKAGVWSAWNPYGVCNETCGLGSYTRTRVCPVSGACVGADTQTTACSLGACLVTRLLFKDIDYAETFGNPPSQSKLAAFRQSVLDALKSNGVNVSLIKTVEIRQGSVIAEVHTSHPETSTNVTSLASSGNLNVTYDGQTLPTALAPAASGDDDEDNGWIAGVVIGSIVGFILIVLLIVFVARHERGASSGGHNVSSAKSDVPLKPISESTAQTDKPALDDATTPTKVKTFSNPTYEYHV